MPLSDEQKLEMRVAAELGALIEDHVSQAPNSNVVELAVRKNQVVLFESSGDGYTLTVERFVNHETES